MNYKEFEAFFSKKAISYVDDDKGLDDFNKLLEEYFAENPSENPDNEIKQITENISRIEKEISNTQSYIYDSKSTKKELSQKSNKGTNTKPYELDPNFFKRLELSYRNKVISLEMKKIESTGSAIPDELKNKAEKIKDEMQALSSDLVDNFSNSFCIETMWYLEAICQTFDQLNLMYDSIETITNKQSQIEKLKQELVLLNQKNKEAMKKRILLQQLREFIVFESPENENEVLNKIQSILNSTNYKAHNRSNLKNVAIAIFDFLCLKKFPFILEHYQQHQLKLKDGQPNTISASSSLLSALNGLTPMDIEGIKNSLGIETEESEITKDE